METRQQLTEKKSTKINHDFSGVDSIVKQKNTLENSSDSLDFVIFQTHCLINEIDFLKKENQMLKKKIFDLQLDVKKHKQSIDVVFENSLQKQMKLESELKKAKWVGQFFSNIILKIKKQNLISKAQFEQLTDTSENNKKNKFLGRFFSFVDKKQDSQSESMSENIDLKVSL